MTDFVDDYANSYAKTLSPEEAAQIMLEIKLLKADREALNAAARNFRFETTWTRTPPAGYDGTIRQWYRELVTLTRHVTDVHFAKQDVDKHHAFILASPDVLCILEHAVDMTRAPEYERKAYHASLKLEWYLNDIPVYKDPYLRPDVLYVGSGNLNTSGSLIIDSISVIKIDNMFSL